MFLISNKSANLFYVLVNTDNASFMPKLNNTKARALFCSLASFVPTKTTDTLTKNAFLWKPDLTPINMMNSYEQTTGSLFVMLVFDNNY